MCTGALDFVLQWLRTSMESLSRGEQSLNELALHATRFVCNLVTNAASDDLVTWLFVKRTPAAVPITTGGAGVEVYRDFDVPVYDVVKGIMSVKGLSATIRSFAVQTLNILGRLKVQPRCHHRANTTLLMMMNENRRQVVTSQVPLIKLLLSPPPQHRPPRKRKSLSPLQL